MLDRNFLNAYYFWKVNFDKVAIFIYIITYILDYLKMC